MKIEPSAKGNMSGNHLREELSDILLSNSNYSSICAPDCPRASPERCSRYCPDISRVMSSDPEKFPLENLIAPLVYELKRLNAFYPCWSCEGHNSPDGKLWKIPRVWFYCDSVVQLRVLANTIKEIHVIKKLNVPWHVAVTFSDDENKDTTFSLEPNFNYERPSLSALQNDIIIIAEHLSEIALTEAHKLLRQVR